MTGEICELQMHSSENQMAYSTSIA